MEAMTDFVLDTKGHCFLCMDLVSSPLIKLEPGDRPDLTSTYTVHYLTRFLKLDMKKVFMDETSTPPELLSKVQNSKLRTDLCEGCLKLSKQFYKLHRKLEKVRLEVDVCLGEIRQKLMEVKDKGATVKFEDVPARGSNFADDLLKQEVVEVLRREAINQCTAILSCPFPRIKVQNMTEQEIRREVLEITSGSGKTVANVILHDVSLKIRKVKQESNSPNLAVDNEEDGDWNGSDNYSSVGSDDNDDSQEEQKYAEATKASSSPETNITQHPGSSSRTPRLGKLSKSQIKMKDGSRKKNGSSFSGVIPPPIKIKGKVGTWQDQYIKSEDTGQCKCRLCPKSYTSPANFLYHIKSITKHTILMFTWVSDINVGSVIKVSPKRRVYIDTIKSAHSGRMINCKVCSRSFTESFNMKAHIRRFHGDKFDSQT